jgi:membrane protein DedA with SNARE-associated domain
MRSDKLLLLSIAIGAVAGMVAWYYVGFWWGAFLCLVMASAIWQWLLQFTAKVRVVDAKILKG